MHWTRPSPRAVPCVPSIIIWVILDCWAELLAEFPTNVTPPSDCIKPGLSGWEGSGLVLGQTLTHPLDCVSVSRWKHKLVIYEWKKVPLVKLLPEWIYGRPKKLGQLAGWRSRLSQSALRCCQLRKHRRFLSKIQSPSRNTTTPWHFSNSSTLHRTRSIQKPEGSFPSRHNSTL